MERAIGRLRTEARARQTQNGDEGFAATIVTRMDGDTAVAPVAGFCLPATRAWSTEREGRPNLPVVSW
jgi:hypothetical protein